MQCRDGKQAVTQAMWLPEEGVAENECWIYRWQIKVQGLALIQSHALNAASKKKCVAAIDAGCLEKRSVLRSEDAEIHDDEDR